MLCILVLSVAQPLTVSAAVPKLNASVTQKNILSLAKKYDANSTYILNYGIKRGESITRWYSTGDRIIDGFNKIMNNKAFAKAYINIEAKFKKQIKTYETNLTKIASLMRNNGLDAKVDGEYFYFGYH